LGRMLPGREHTLAVRVWRRPTYPHYGKPTPPAIPDDREVPYTAVDYWPYAGITRSAFLECSSAVSVSKLLTATAGNRLTVHAVVVNEGRIPVWRTLVLDPGTGARPARREVRLGAGEVRVVSASFDVTGVRRWSARTPVVHELRAELRLGAFVEDVLTTGYGLREVTVSDSRVWIDGVAQFFKGMNWHEETAARGRSMTAAEYDVELGGMAAVGVNLIRNCVYTRHPYVYDWADRHGMMVLDDCDNMWLNLPQQRLQTSGYGLSRAVATMMAWHQVNHPSVVMWCLQNESEVQSTTDTTTYRAWIADMRAAVRAVDPQRRPITWASSTSWDIAFDLADVVGFNEYFGYFYGKDSDLGPTIDAVARNHPGKPILITENGTWSLFGNHGSPDVAGTEEWQAEKFRRHWAQVVVRDHVCGYIFWVYKDYKQRRGYNQEYNGISTMGLVEFTHERPRLVHTAFRDAQVPPR
jgi:beta-glucuronidase